MYISVKCVHMIIVVIPVVTIFDIYILYSIYQVQIYNIFHLAFPFLQVKKYFLLGFWFATNKKSLHCDW